jgi:hypothetical protein
VKLSSLLSTTRYILDGFQMMKPDSGDRILHVEFIP